MNFSLWAPEARRAELRLGSRTHPLEPSSGGVWRTEIPLPAADAGYRFAIDGDEAWPDPRSLWQPDGVHGDSHPADLDALRRRPRPPFAPRPLAEAVLYELHVGTFTPEGTYAAARGKLGHLAELGVTHVEIMPVATFPGRRGWGYDGVYLYAPHPAFGRPEELAGLVDACHAHGLAVLLDVVYNHLGPDGNYAPKFGPYLTDRYKTDWGQAMNFDGPGSDGVRDFVIDNARMWLRDYGFDGLRLDAVHAIECLGAVHVLEDLAVAVDALARQLARDLVLIAESDLNDPRLVREPEQGGYGLQAHWCDDFHHALHAFLTGERQGYYADFGTLEDLAVALREGYVYQGQHSAFRRRRHGRPPTGVPPHRLVVCCQNHDQVGNRARGERLSQLLGPLPLRAAAALTLLSPFTPLLFQGEEWGAQSPFLYFTDHTDPALGKAVTEGRRREHAGVAGAGEVPDPQAEETWRRSQLRWEELARPGHADLLEWYRGLIALRRRHLTAAADRTPSVRCEPAAGWLTLACGGLLGVFNFADAAQPIPLPAGRWRLGLSTDGESAGPVAAHGTRVMVREA
ncbi:MAG TPA: malto-oligosyltrehalose trehalohydrolase [Opitutaceae bacterium]|nr:malto-oligosyltrehalose trehalohydrolase [Opitutaceae bacterium]